MKKKKEKHKKHKKHKKRKHHSDSSESEDEWEEASVATVKTSPHDRNSPSESLSPPVAHVAPVDPTIVSRGPTTEGGEDEKVKTRDEWLTSSSFLDVVCNATHSRENKTKQRKLEEKKKEEERSRAIEKSRELNPHLRNEQAGLSHECQSTAPRYKSESKKDYGVADRGQSWIHKAYERAKQRALEENRPLEDIVIKQWGSMEKLEALLKSASRTSSKSSSSSSVRGGSGGWRKASSSHTSTSEKSCKLEEKTDDNTVANSDLDRKQERNSNQSLSSDEGESSKMNSHKGGSSEINSHEGDSSKINECSGSRSVPNVATSKTTLTEKERNELSAKLVRAELMGDEDLVKKLKRKLGGSDETEPVSIKVPKVKLGKKERNELGAKLVRAELMGDDDMVKKLKRKLEGEEVYGNEEDKGKEGRGNSDGNNEVLLTRSDKHGNLYPVRSKAHADDSDDDDDDDHRNSKRKRNNDLKTMIEEEHLTSVDDHQAMTARFASKHLPRVPSDEYYTIDDMFVKASTKTDTKNDDKHIRERAIAEDRLQKKQLSSCRFCLDNPNIAKHLVISIGTNVYLALPINASLTEGHCLIIPTNHRPAQTYLDEDVLQEINKFKKSLTRMFANASDDEDVIFLETCKDVKHGKHHCVIECIPVPKEIGDMGPIYFKKAITETGSEWSGNKKLVTVTSKHGVTRALPKGLPYFAVEFGIDGGFGHIIEEQSFPRYFGKEIIGGMMDLEPRFWMRPPKESFEQHKRKILKFTESWKEYDCTS